MAKRKIMPIKPRTNKMLKIVTNRRYTLTQPIINLCSKYALLDAGNRKTTIYDNVSGRRYDPYQQASNGGFEKESINELMRQMLNAMYDPYDVYDLVCAPNDEGEPNCIYCHKCTPSTLHVTYSTVDVANIKAPLCIICKAELLRIHKDISSYLNIIIQCGRVPGVYEEHVEKNRFGGDIVYWKRLSKDQESIEMMFGLYH